MKRPKNNTLYWLFKIASVIVSCAFPLWAIYERHPEILAVHEKRISFGMGGIIVAFVVLFVFRKSVFGFIRERLRLKHAPPFLGWLVPMSVGYAILYLNEFANDMVHASKMGFIGGAIGVVMTFVAENFLRVNKKKEEVNNG